MLARVLAALGLPAADGVVLVITLTGLVVTYAIALRYARAEPAVAFGLAVLAVMLWTRRYSPQYSLWILPTLALTPVPGRTIAVLAIAVVLRHAALVMTWRSVIRLARGDRSIMSDQGDAPLRRSPKRAS